MRSLRAERKFQFGNRDFIKKLLSKCYCRRSFNCIRRHQGQKMKKARLNGDKIFSVCSIPCFDKLKGFS